ncbi:MAG: DUF1016 domain-containing protein [Gloeobacteraceae cyanobacterium ES-bin-316]|nr:DUF1016 domain-containing protein [Ferruginibacter sp.]
MTKPVSRKKLFVSVKNIIETARENIVRNVNTTMLLTYFEIGRMITEDEQKGNMRAGYADETIKNLSVFLSNSFGKGYSPSNLEYCRKFYQTYSIRISQSLIGKSQITKKSSTKLSTTPVKKPISQSVIGILQNPLIELPFKLSWTHYIQLLKIADDDERGFYEIESVANNWSVRELQRQYNSSVYERLVLSKNKKAVKALSTKGQLVEKTSDALKSHYVLEFLGLKEEDSYTENDLETAIINKVEDFMLELGKGFLFEGRQRRFTFDGDSFFVDLVFYNRLLKCFVLIDLKIGKLMHQDIGQMQMYVNYYDRKIKLPKENKTIGIILCKEENKTVIEFTLPQNNNQIFAKEYKAVLPTKAALAKQLI